MHVSWVRCDYPAGDSSILFMYFKHKETSQSQIYYIVSLALTAWGQGCTIQTFRELILKKCSVQKLHRTTTLEI